MNTADGLGDTPIITLPSPCIGVCQIDEATKLCVGCARTEAEIAVWKDTADPERQRIWDALPGRRQSVGIELFKLLWFPSDFLSFIDATVRRQGGEWTIGIQGANVTFDMHQMENASVVRDETSLTLQTSQIAWRFITHQKAAAFALGDKVEENGPQAIGLALPRSRISISTSSHFCRIGEDADAIVSAGRNAPLYDLGLGDKGMRFCLRAMSPASAEICDALNGCAHDIAIARLLQINNRSGLQYVIETGLGRCEILASNGNGNEPSPKLSLDAELLNNGRESPPDWELHPAFAPCAVFRPDSGHSIASITDALT